MPLLRRNPFRLVWFSLSLLVAPFHIQAAGADAADMQKLNSAVQLVQSIIDEDAKPKGGFYTRDPKFPAFPGQPVDDCATFSIVRSIEVQEPYFESSAKNVVVVPVKAELLMVRASHSGGKLAAVDGSLPSTCAFEYERWSERSRRFEKVPGFRTRTHIEEFTRWGEAIANSEIGAWIAIPQRNRSVRFLARVNVARERPHQIAPQFPVHHLGVNALRVLEESNNRKKELLKMGRSDRDLAAHGNDLRRDLERMRAQFVNNEWVISKLKEALADTQRD